LTEGLPRFERDAEGSGVIFFLQDEVRVSIRGNTETRATTQLWRADDPSTMTPTYIGNILSESFRERLTKAAAEKFGEDYNPDTEGGRERLATLKLGLDNISIAFARGAEQDTGRAVREFLSVRGPSRPMLLLKYASVAEYFHDADQEAFATVPQDLHKETWAVKSRSFNRWLRYRFYIEEKQRLGGVHEPAPLRNSLVADVLTQLAAKAQFEGVQRPVNLRVAEAGGNIYLDLCDKKWRVVEISPEGWALKPAGEGPVKFTREKGMAALPLPDRESASLEPLQTLLNLQGAEGERSYRLILAWLVQALRSSGPYPILVLLGERGSAKSTAARILRSLLDPSTVSLRTMPRSPHDLYIDAVSSWIVSLDNIGSLPHWLSDMLCMLSTGGGFSTRTLFTDRDQELFSAMRPAILNGISDVATRDDLVQRSLIVQLPTIERGGYRPEREIHAELRSARPKILGALLNAAATGLMEVPFVELDAVPRMADFAKWATATEAALGAQAGDFMDAYRVSESEGARQALEAEVLSDPIYTLAENNSENGGWSGTATEMLRQLVGLVDEDVTRSREWPKAPNALSRRLRRLAALYREVGTVHIEELQRGAGSGVKKWRIAKVG